MAVSVVSNAASSSTTVVTMDVPSATILDTTACAPDTTGVTAFGVVQPGTRSMTSGDCSVTWGSSNDSASLRLAQSDGIGTAMAQNTLAWTRHTGSSSRMIDVASAAGTTLTLRSNGEVRRSTDGGATFSSAFASGVGVYGRISVGSSTTAWVSTDSTTVRRSTNINTATPTFAATAANPGLTRTRDVTAISGTTAWVVGDAGGVVSTTTSGTSWTTHAPVTAQALSGIRHLDSDSLVAWGDNGTVVATSDGTTWRNISIAGATDINDVWITSDSVMVAVADHRIYRTINATAGSPTWTSINPKLASYMRAVAFVDASNGVVFGDEGFAVVTTDGGATWTNDDVDSSHSVAAATTPAAGTYVVVGAGNSIQRSTDSGATWSHVTLPEFAASWEAVVTSTDGRAWRVGGDGRIERSTNGGTSWTAQTSSTTEDLFGVEAFSADRVVAVGRGGTVVTTSDGGATWTARATPTGADLLDVTVVDGGTAWATGSDATIVKSTDYGATWVVQATTPGETLLTVTAVSTTKAVAFGNDGLARRTSDGATWSTFVPPTTSSPIRASARLPGTQTIGYIGGGSFVRSVDGGASWVDLSGFENMYPEDLAWADASTLHASGRGLMYQSTDGGVTWASTPSAVTNHWGGGIASYDVSRTVVVGDGNLSGSTGSTNPVADYSQGASDWYDDGVEAFGVCLRATDGTPTWTVNATCDMSADGAHWRGIPTSTGAGSEVAQAASIAGTRSASFRFGLRVDPAQPPGQLSAGLTFLVLAPAA